MRKNRARSQPGFVIAWEFYVRPSERRAFEKAYGPEGDWAKFFRSAKGYICTELIRDLETPVRYLTFDFWTSGEAFDRFKKENRAEYHAIDQKCASLTEKERQIGHFETVGGR